jgi:hypothetical protein
MRGGAGVALAEPGPTSFDVPPETAAVGRILATPERHSSAVPDAVRRGPRLLLHEPLSGL